VKGFLGRDLFERLAVPAVGGGIPQHPLDVMHLGLVVSTPFAQKGPSDVPIQIHGLSCPGVFNDVKNQNSLPIHIHALLGHLNVVIHFLVGMEDREKIVLDLIGMQYPRDIKCFGLPGNPQYQPSAMGIRKGGNGFEARFRQLAAGGLELDVVPLSCLEEILKLADFHLLDSFSIVHCPVSATLRETGFSFPLGKSHPSMPPALGHRRLPGRLQPGPW